MQKRSERVAVPQKPIPLMWGIYKKILPAVHRQLAFWTRKAEQIPNEELRTQALASIASKKFHCQGGGVYGLLAHPSKLNAVITFIVAYQTISDYLDNLCDRSVSLDGKNFRQLHQAMVDAISGEITADNYYAGQSDQNDGGYLRDLVKTCHSALKELVSYEKFQAPILTLCELYCDLQVYKHISWDKREDALKVWWSEHEAQFPRLEWYEFAAATGSTLGIFYYVALSSHQYVADSLDKAVFDAYFPYIQGLHILLDYLIDQEEDRRGGDLNFCFYYPSEVQKLHRFDWFAQQAKAAADKLPDAPFHRMIVEGLLGIYLSQDKVKQQKDVLHISRRLLKRSKLSTWFFFINSWYIHQKGKHWD